MQEQDDSDEHEEEEPEEDSDEDEDFGSRKGRQASKKGKVSISAIRI